MYRCLCIVLVLVAVAEPTDWRDWPSRLIQMFTGKGRKNGQYSVQGCMEAANVTEEDITSLFSSKFNPEMDNPQKQCFVACWIEGIGTLKSDGTVGAAELVHAMEKIVERQIENADEVIEVLTKCADQPGEGCQKKFKIAACVQLAQDLIRYQKSG